MTSSTYEASIIRIMYDKYVNEMLGPEKICNYVSEQGIRNRKGELFKGRTIRGMLINPLYKGILRCGEATNQIEELRIISDELFEKAESIRNQRHAENMEKRRCSMGKKREVLLSGILFCGTCGGRLTFTQSNRKHDKKDRITRRWIARRYNCYNKKTNKLNCAGKGSHTVSVIGEVIIKVVQELFNNVKDVHLENIKGTSQNTKIHDLETRLNQANLELVKLENRLDALNEQAIKIIAGEITFPAETVNAGIAKTKNERELVVTQISEIQKEMQTSINTDIDMKSQHDKILNWAEIFISSDITVKSKIIRNIIEKITVFDEKNIEIEFKMSIKKYLELVGGRKL